MKQPGAAPGKSAATLAAACQYCFYSNTTVLVHSTFVSFRKEARCELYVKMACKRKLDYFEVSEAKESSNAVVDGMVTELSPLKKSKDGWVKYLSHKLV